MTSDEFNRMIQTWGSRPERWPAASREAVLRCADALDPAGRALLDRQRLLDALLDTVRSPEVTPELRSRVMATIPPERASVVRRHPWGSSAGLVGVATIGVAAGMLFMSLLLSPVSRGVPMPGSPEGAVSYRLDAFAIPATDPEEN